MVQSLGRIVTDTWTRWNTTPIPRRDGRLQQMMAAAAGSSLKNMIPINIPGSAPMLMRLKFVGDVCQVAPMRAMPRKDAQLRRKVDTVEAANPLKLRAEQC